MNEFLRPAPWDSSVLGRDAWEITDLSVKAFSYVEKYSGHYCVRVSPLFNKKILHDAGFYYCDTLIEPYCVRKNFVPYFDSSVTVNTFDASDPLMDICSGAFQYDRFHRDFNVDALAADCRYNNWLRQLSTSAQLYGVQYVDRLAAFIAVEKNKLVLHAVSKEFQGLGLAKAFWTPVCQFVWAAGFDEIVSSVSAANLAVVNLYSRLGFRFRNAVDIYHKVTP